MKFQSDLKAKQKFLKITRNIEKKLASIDSEVALEFVDWFERKATYLKQTSQKVVIVLNPMTCKREMLYGLNLALMWGQNCLIEIKKDIMLSFGQLI